MATPSEQLSDALANNSRVVSTPGMNALATGPHTGIALLDAILGNSADMLSNFTGNNNIKYIPVPGAGMNMREAYAARDITTPLWRIAQDQMAYQYGASFGASMAQVGIAAGVNRMMKMSPDEFSRNLVNAGSSPMGRSAMEFMFQQPAMQAAFGGNPMAMAEMAFSHRQMLGNTEGGNLLNPYDITGQTAYAQHASDIAMTMARAAYSGPKGMSGVLNPNVTQGFNVNEFAYIGLRAAQSGMPGMRGLEVGADQFTANTIEAAKAVATFRSMMPGSSVIENMDMMQRLGGADTFRRSNVQGIDMAGSQIKALSAIYNGSDVLGTAVNVAETFRAAGFNPGMTAATSVASRIHATAMTTGGDLNDITARTAGMALSGLNSRQGGDVIAMEWMRQGMIDNPANPNNKEAGRIYDNWQNALVHGTKAEQAHWANKMYQSIGVGMEGVMSSKVGRSSVYEDVLTQASRDRVDQQIYQGQQKEFTERSKDVITARRQYQLADVAGRAGMGFIDTTAAAVDGFLSAVDNLAASGRPELKDVAQVTRDQLAQAKTPGERRAVLERMKATGALGDDAIGVGKVSQEWERNALQEKVMGGEGSFLAMKQVELMRQLGHGEAVNNVLAADYGGDLAKRDAAIDKVTNSTLTTPSEKGMLATTMGRGRSEWDNLKHIVQVNADAELMSTAANSMPGGVAEANKQLKALSSVLGENVYTPEYIAGLVGTASIISPSQKEAILAAAKTPLGSAARDTEMKRLNEAGLVSQIGAAKAGAAIGGYGRTNDELSGSAPTEREAQAMAQGVAVRDKAMEDMGLGKSSTGVAGFIWSQMSGASVEESLGALVGVEGLGMKDAQAAEKPEADKKPAASGSKAGGPVHISGTLNLHTGHVRGQIN